jgi:hypothetical protein
VTRVSFFNVCFFSTTSFWAEADECEKAVEEAFEAEEGADEEEKDDACYDADDDACDRTAA